MSLFLMAETVPPQDVYRANPSGSFWREFLAFLIKSHVAEWNFHTVRDADEIQQAFRLVYREYFKRGYIRENPHEMFFHFHSLLPHALIFVATDTLGQVGGTIKLIPDDPEYGLPIEKVFPGEVRELRRRGKHIGEVGMLAVDTAPFNEKSPALGKLIKMKFLGQLYRLMFIHACRVAELDELVIMVNERHVWMYEAFCFRREGEAKTYKSLNDASAVFMRMDIPKAITAGGLHGETYDRFFYPDQEKSFIKEVEKKYHLDLSDLDYFLAVDRSVGWLSGKERERLRDLYRVTEDEPGMLFTGGSHEERLAV